VHKKKLLGCSFPFVIVISVLLLLVILISLVGGPVGTKLLGRSTSFLPTWMQVNQPSPELPAEPLFHVGTFPVTNTLLTTWISIIIIIVLAALATRRMKLIPGKLQALFEYAVSVLLNLCESIAGTKYGRQVFPVCATIFVLVFVNAWTSLIPGYGSITWAISEHGETIWVPLLRGANTDINLPLALAIIAFVTTWIFGFKASGIKYLEQFIQFRKLGRGIKEIFTGKVKSGLGNIGFGVIDIFVGVLEFISNVIRLVSFTFRLFGNMTAGEVLLLTISFLVPWGLSIVFYGLEMLVGVVQALAFSMLTLIFTSIAVAGSHSEEEHEAKASH
jgi:F-type H+-transporting ATPase subunit a